MDLEKEHKGTLGYLGMTTHLASENRLYFKACIKRITNCMRSNGITSNVRRKKRNRIKRHEEYINDNLKELETLVQDAVDYFNRKRAYASKNGLTAE